MSRNTIDPRLEKPPVAGLNYDEDEVGYIPIESEVTVTMPPISGGLLPPDNITVISQKLRRGKGGKDVVDLVIEVDDVQGATEYEVRVTAR